MAGRLSPINQDANQSLPTKLIGKGEADDHA